MAQYKAKNGTVFAYPDEIEGETVIVLEGAEGEPPRVCKVDTGAVLEFAEFLFDKAKYEAVARLRVCAGDVILVRVPEMSDQAMVRIENQVRDAILKPMGLADKCQVVALNGAIDLEVVTTE